MKKIIIANWKCNPTTQTEVERLFDVVEKGIKNIKDLKNIDIVICPPFVWLDSLKIENWKLKIQLGAQDCHWEQNGAYTGEVSGAMLKDIGCNYVIIGHSERRKYFDETNEMVNKKLLAALKARLKPILCVGEKGEEEMSSVIKSQLIEGLKNINRAQMRDIAIAYEPVWAIGTGNPCQSDDAMKAGLFIRQALSKLYNRKLAEEISILYGGSVNSKIAAAYIKEAKMNGLLVGGASLDGAEFVKIVKQVKENA